MKFGRIYSIQAEGIETSFASGTQHVINFPITCRFRITQACLPYAAVCTLQILNLSPEVRRDLYKDMFQQNQFRKIVFAAGYASQLPLPIILQGNIETAYSYRRGSDWITEIQARDGLFAQQNSQINLSVPSPYRFDKVLEQLVDSMSKNHVRLGAIGNFQVPNSRGMAFSGNTWDLLVNMVLPFRSQITINKELVYILNQNEVIERDGAIDTINEESGLLDSPRHQENMLICRMIFEPRFEIFQSVEVESIEPGNSGTWKVQQVDHMGTISGAVCDDLNTEVTLFQSHDTFEVVSPLRAIA